MPSSKSQYHRFGLIAQGQFGKVYCALHRRSGKMVALKILDARRSPTAEFLRELSATLALNHPNLVQVYGVEHHNKQRHLILDYCEGGTLRQLIEREPKPQQGILLQIMRGILAGLEHAHQRGIIHCDVKPENILLTLTPRGWHPKLTDFGIAHNRNLPQTETLGSPAYMAPEYFEGHISPAVDIYAVGIILYELFSGQRPFQGPPEQLKTAHQTQAIPWPTSIPACLQPILDRALAKHPQQRIQSAAYLSQLLRETDQHITRETTVPPFPWLFAPLTIDEQQLQSQRGEHPSDSQPDDSVIVDGSVMAMAPDQSWCVHRKAGTHQLYCRRQEPGSVPYPLGIEYNHNPQKQTFQRNLLILDSRHGIAWSTAADKTELVLFNRRGMMLSPIGLETPITQAFSSQQPLQFLALERNNPRVLLKISLRPFRVQRIPLAIAPVSVLSLSWSIILADAQGRLFLMDHDGHPLGLVTSLVQRNSLLNATSDSNTMTRVELLRINEWEVAIAIHGPFPSSPSEIHRICLKDLELELIF